MSNELIAQAEGFADRFAVERIADGGVLVDLLSGSYFRLNGTAAVVCSVLAAGPDPVTAEVRTAATLNVPLTEARAIVSSVLRDLDGVAPTEEPVGPFRYRRRENNYILTEADRTIFEVDVARRELHLLERIDSLRFAILDYVRAVTPKLLGLSGVLVLHAATCTARGRTIAFSGKSGAGKTTTMRAFVAGGAAGLSEDLLLLARDAVVPAAYLAGEAQVHAWAQATADSFRGTVTTASFATLGEAPAGPTQPLDEIWFVDVARRKGHAFERKVLGPIDGTLALLRQTFLGAADPMTWRRHLRSARGLADQLGLFEAIMPAGHAALNRAAADYTLNSAS